MIKDGKSTMRRMTLGLVERVDQSSLKRFLTLYGWDEEGVNRRRLESDQTIGAERRQAIKNFIQSPIHLVYKMANKMPVEKVLKVILG